MAKRPLGDYSTDELKSALRRTQRIQLTIAAIFLVIIAVWIFGGHVDDNPLVFTSTVVMAIALVTLQYASTAALRKELADRE